ncbi:hypothetical protein QUC31_004248, partial [Theobroma cacao]
CLGKLSGKPVLTNKTENEMVNEVHVGVILDMGSLEGKILQRCISMAISDFYSVHDHYKTRLVLHTRDSKGETLNALSAGEKLLSNLSRFVVSVWVFVVLILTSSYTATLTSMMTVKQIRLKSEKNYVGYQNNSIIHGVVSNQNFDNYSRHLFSSPKAYADALSKGSKSGGVSAIIDELPYLKIFLAKFSKDFSLIGSMTTTSGFGFAFPQGSQLARDISTEIVKMRQEGKLIMMEDAWFTSQATFTWEDSSDSVSPLTIDSFRGLFLISGTCSGLALFMFLVFVLYKKWPTVC